MNTSFSAPGQHGSIVVDALVGPDLTFEPHTLIEWREGYITRVEPQTKVERESVTAEVSGVAIPGLIDAHVHLALNGAPDVVADLATLPADEIDALMVKHASEYATSGITTVRDLGAPAGSVARLQAAGVLSAPVSPRVLPAQAISTPTGHGNFISRHAETLDDYRRIIDSLDPQVHPFLKLFASGGVITSGSNPAGIQMEADVLVAVTAYAHDMGFRVASHAHSRASIANCVDAGVDTIEHFSYLDDELASRVAGSSSFLVSTYVATHRFAHSPNRDGAEPEALEKILNHDAIEAQALRTAATIAHRVIAGSDSGTILNPHPKALLEAGKLMVDAGFSHVEALKSMTSRSASALGFDGGLIAVGQPADIVVCASNPTDDIAAVGTVKQVIIAGYPVRP